MLAFIADRLRVDENALRQMANGEIMRIAEVDIPNLYGWQYRNRDLPEAAIDRLHPYFLTDIGREG